MRSVTLYPFLPLIKERSSIGGNIVEITLIFMLFCELIAKKHDFHILVINKYIVVIVDFLLFFLMEGIINEQSAFSGFRAFLFYIFLIYYLLNIENTQLYNITYACIFSGIIMALGALVQIVFPDIISAVHSSEIWMDLRLKTDFTAFSIYNRAISFMTDPNILSVYLDFVFFIGNAFFSEGKKKKLFQIIMVVSICTTQSRTGLVLVLMYFFLIFFENILTRRSIKMSTLIIISLLAIIGGVYIVLHWNKLISFLRIDTILNGNGRAGNNTVNIEYIFSNNFWNILFGVGLGNGQSYIFENSYYLLLYMFGVVGSIFFLFLMYRILKPICIKKNTILGMVYLVACLVGDYILIPHVTYVLIIGLVMTSVKHRNETEGGIENESCSSN